MRFCRKTETGTYLVPFRGEGIVREFDASGKVIREFPKLGGAVGAVRLPDGNTLITGGGKVVEFDKDNRIVWELTSNDLLGIHFAVPAGVQRLENGNTLVCNWGSRDNNEYRCVSIFEVSPEKKILWTVESRRFGKVASCQLLTPDFKPATKGNRR